MARSLIARSLAFVVAALFAAAPACQTFEGPPEPTLQNLSEGLIEDRAAPLVLLFNKKFDPKTLQVKLAKYVTDSEGNLADEDKDDATTLELLYFRDEKGLDHSGTGVVGEDGKSFAITLEATPPVGASLVLIIEEGLSDGEGHVTTVRRKIVFSFGFELKCDEPTTVMQSGAFFFLLGVKKPISVQVQLFGILDVDPATGEIVIRLTNADRNPDDNRCDPPCDDDTWCRLLPMQACVAQSEQAGTVDEFSDYVPNAMPPTGYSFQATGCAVDQDGSTVVMSTAPVDVVVQSPNVTLRNAQFIGSFTRGDDGILRGTGTLSADDVLLGIISSGRGEGTLNARSIPPGEEPPGIPVPEVTE